MKSKLAALAFLLVLGMYGSAAVARADLGWDMIRVCTVLDDYPTISGVLGVLRGLTDEGYTAREAGWIVGRAVRDVCPEHMNLALRFAQAGASTTIA